MKFFHILLTVLLAAVVSWGVVSLTPGAVVTEKETALQRVLRTNTLRCGYIVWPPYLLKDVNTGQYSGVAYDFMSAIARELEIKLEWVEEVGWGNFHEGLNAGRYDAMCVPVWQGGNRARIALMTHPLYYNALYALKRADDQRFATLEEVNKPGVRITVTDGSIEQNVRRLRFPNAEEVALPQNTDSSQSILSLATNKADIAFDNLTNANRYNETADRKLVMAGGQPVRVFANVIAVKLGEDELANTLNAVIDALKTIGEGDVLAAKYAPDIMATAPR
ncbi:MAG: substrate-binding periplasmic protein [Bdellovibrionales bacterium]